MPLDLDARSVSRFDDRALHRQLADAIRAAIDSGQLAPAEALPSEADLASTIGLSRTAIRHALDILATEGLIIKRAGSVTRVATPPPIRHMATSRYADEIAILQSLGTNDNHPTTSAFTVDHGIDWSAYRVESHYIDDDGANDDDASRLGIKVGAAVLRRQLIKYVADQPVQIQESVMPLALIKGTAVADPSRQPWPGGTIAELWSIGQIVTRVVEEARARTPTTAERRILEMDAAGPVWDITRTFYVDMTAVEVSTVVCPAASIVLRYETALN